MFERFSTGRLGRVVPAGFPAGVRPGGGDGAVGFGFSSTSSSGTMRAPVPFVSLSKTHVFAI